MKSGGKVNLIALLRSNCPNDNEFFPQENRMSVILRSLSARWDSRWIQAALRFRVDNHSVIWYKRIRRGERIRGKGASHVKIRERVCPPWSPLPLLIR
jgi:hypothetical protein